MKCKKSERFLLRSLDDRLNPSDAVRLKQHVEACSFCKKRQMDYTVIRHSLNEIHYPELKPYFWERLQPKLKEKRTVGLWTIGKQFGLRAIPLSVLFMVLLSASILFFSPSTQEEWDLSETGIFLLQNSNPLEETNMLLSEEAEGNKHLMLIFSSLDETSTGRIYLP